MREFKKSSKLDHVGYDIRGPVLDEADRMEAKGQKIVKLNIGNPATFGFRTPDNILNTMKENLENAQGYSTSKGIKEAREAILKYHRGKGINVESIEDIYTGNGVSELITLSMQALLDNGDEVLVPAPDYPLWTASVTLSGGNAVHYICDECNNWYPDLKDIESKVTSKTKAIVIINPNNPTGAIYPDEILEGILEIANKYDLIIFSDEIYDRLTFDGVKHTSIASLDKDQFCITFSGLSKSHMVAGYRVGWMVLSGNKENVKGYIEGINMLSSMRLCSNVESQYIIPEALKGSASPEKDLIPGGRLYEQREMVCKCLDKIEGVSYVKPQSAFYIFPKIDVEKFNIVDDEKMCLDFLKEKQILLVHGKGFHWDEPNHFRIVYLPNVDDLEYAVNQLGDFLKDYKQ